MLEPQIAVSITRKPDIASPYKLCPMCAEKGIAKALRCKQRRRCKRFWPAPKQCLEVVVDCVLERVGRGRQRVDAIGLCMEIGYALGDLVYLLFAKPPFVYQSITEQLLWQPTHLNGVLNRAWVVCTC
jgi:hypothetical protein